MVERAEALMFFLGLIAGAAASGFTLLLILYERKRGVPDYPGEKPAPPKKEVTVVSDALVEKIMEFIEKLYQLEPNLRDEGLKNFDGYFVHWDEIIKQFKGAWPEIYWDASPAELITRIINERDEAKALQDKTEALCVKIINASAGLKDSSKVKITGLVQDAEEILKNL